MDPFWGHVGSILEPFRGQFRTDAYDDLYDDLHDDVYVSADIREYGHLSEWVAGAVARTLDEKELHATATTTMPRGEQPRRKEMIIFGSLFGNFDGNSMLNVADGITMLKNDDSNSRLNMVMLFRKQVIQFGTLFGNIDGDSMLNVVDGISRLNNYDGIKHGDGMFMLRYHRDLF